MPRVRGLQPPEATETRARLLKIARKAFSARGYAGVSAEEIARRARVTRATLYYHFSDKKQLFGEACQEIEREFSERIASRARRPSRPWRRLHAACEAALDSFLDPAYRRTAILDGPTVLGWKRWRTLLSRSGRQTLREALGEAMDARLIKRQPLEPLAQILTGALNEAGLMIAHSRNRRATRAEAGRAIARLIDGLRAGPGARPARKPKRRRSAPARRRP